MIKSMLAVLLLAAFAAPAYSAKPGDTANKSAVSDTASKHSASSGSQQVRDWSAIDTNKDHYISPDEMEKYLQAQWNKNGSTANR